MGYAEREAVENKNPVLERSKDDDKQSRDKQTGVGNIVARADLDPK